MLKSKPKVAGMINKNRNNIWISSKGSVLEKRQFTLTKGSCVPYALKNKGLENR